MTIRPFAVLGTLVLAAPVTMAQHLDALQILYLECDSMSAVATTSFVFGVGLNCPELVGMEVTDQGPNTTVDLYYDVSGVWAQAGCWTTDSIHVSFTPGTGSVELRLQSVNYVDTSAVFSDTTLAACVTGLPDHTARQSPVFTLYGDQLTWAPEILPVDGEVEILSSTGAVVRSVKGRIGMCPIAGLASGVYLVRCTGMPYSTAERIILGPH